MLFEHHPTCVGVGLGVWLMVVYAQNYTPTYILHFSTTVLHGIHSKNTTCMCEIHKKLPI